MMRQFHISATAPCPYLEGKQERKLMTRLDDQDARAFETLTQKGFRRSQNIAYSPACIGCRDCLATRVIAERFEPTQSMRRVMRRNRDLAEKELDNSPTREQFRLFRLYLKARHDANGMADMTFRDYCEMVADSPVQTKISEFRSKQDGKLIAVVLFDRMSDHLSMVYSFFDPREPKRGLGTFVILRHIAKARAEGLTYCHLGYWIKNSPQMAYKSRFLPQQRLIEGVWRTFER